MLFIVLGLEHHICKLADLRLPHMVVHAVDGAGQEEIRHAYISLHGVLREPAYRAAVHLELPNTATCPRPLPEEGRALQGTGL